MEYYIYGVVLIILGFVAGGFTGLFIVEYLKPICYITDNEVLKDHRQETLQKQWDFFFKHVKYKTEQKYDVEFTKRFKDGVSYQTVRQECYNLDLANKLIKSIKKKGYEYRLITKEETIPYFVAVNDK